MSDDPIDLSIVVACFNEEPHLERNVGEILRVLDTSRWNYEIIFIDDGSRDGTPDVIRRLVDGDARMRAVFHEKNLGRGGTVSEGLRMAQGTVAGFLDIDLEIHCRYIPSMVDLLLRNQADVATALRVYKINLTPTGIVRWILSVGYRMTARIALESPFRDTETGFKFFRRETILPVLDSCHDSRWFWDTEVMLEAHAAGLRVVEMPALFQRQSQESSSLRVVADTMGYLRAIREYRRRKARA